MGTLPQELSSLPPPKLEPEGPCGLYEHYKQQIKIKSRLPYETQTVSK